jgi:ribose-phosphate pyrophosphokinase
LQGKGLRKDDSSDKMTDLKIFSGRSNRPLAEKIAAAAGRKLGACEIQNFRDGEIWVKYWENIRGADVYIIQSTHPPAENLTELLLLIDAAKRASSRRVTAVIPYFGYARQDRKDQPRVAVSAKLVANLITTAGADRVITMDLHAPQIQGFFDIPLDHLYASPILATHYKRKRIRNLAVVSPDVGGIRLARAYAKRLDADLVLIDKRRPRINESEILNIIGDTEGKNVLIIDDIIDTAGTFTRAVEALQANGVNEVYGACTHAVLSGNAVERVEKSAVAKLTVTDTIPLKVKSPKIEVQSVARMFAEAITRSHFNRSISSLFDIDKDKV